MDSNGRTIWIADAHRDDGKRLVLHADEKLTAFVKFESAHGKRAASPTESDSDRRTHAKNSGAELLPGKPRESSLLAEMRGVNRGDSPLVRATRSANHPRPSDDAG